MQYSNKREVEEDLEHRELSVFETAISFANVLWGKKWTQHVCCACRTLSDAPNVTMLVRVVELIVENSLDEGVWEDKGKILSYVFTHMSKPQFSYITMISYIFLYTFICKLISSAIQQDLLYLSS